MPSGVRQVSMSWVPLYVFGVRTLFSYCRIKDAVRRCCAQKDSVLECELKGPNFVVRISFLGKCRGICCWNIPKAVAPVGF